MIFNQLLRGPLQLVLLLIMDYTLYTMYIEHNDLKLKEDHQQRLQTLLIL